MQIVNALVREFHGLFDPCNFGLKFPDVFFDYPVVNLDVIHGIPNILNIGGHGCPCACAETEAHTHG